MHASARDDQRGAGGREHLGGFGDPFRIRHHTVEGEVAEDRLACRQPCRRKAEDISRYQEHGRSRAAGGRGPEGHVDIVVEALGEIDAANPFGDRVEQSEMVEFLECVLVGLRPWHFLDQGDDRHGGLQRLGERRYEQGRRGSVLGGDHGHAIAHAGVGVGHRSASIFSTIGRLLDAEIGGCQVEGGGDALAEGDADAVPMEGPRQPLGDRLVTCRGVFVEHLGWPPGGRRRAALVSHESEDKARLTALTIRR